MTPEMPDENYFARVVARAHDSLPEPDMRRLAAIEAQLVRRSVLVQGGEGAARWRYWWLVLALAASGSAAALWWAFDYASRQGLAEVAPMESPATITKPVPEVPGTANKPTSSDGRGEPGRQHNPVIYRQQRCQCVVSGSGFFVNRQVSDQSLV